MFLYGFGEADGPFRCRECGCVTWDIYSDKNHQVGRRALYDGIPLCDTHAPDEVKSRRQHQFDTFCEPEAI